MKRVVMLFFVLVTIIGWVNADDPLLRSFQSTATDGKLALLRRLHAEPTEAATPVYLAALNYSVDHANRARDDARVDEIGRLAIESLATLGVSEGSATVWRYFKAQSSDELRIFAVQVLEACGDEVSDEIVYELNDFLSGLNHLSRSGLQPNAELVSRTVSTLSTLGRPASFAVLFEAAMHPNYPDIVSSRAATGLSRLDVDVDAEVLAILESATLDQYDAVLAFSVRSESLGEETRVAIAETVLRYTMESRYRDLSDAQQAKELRHRAAVRLSRLAALSPPSLALTYFETVYQEYQRGQTTLAYVIEAVGMLGETGYQEAAVRLDQLLESMNVQVEYNQQVNDQLVIATIEAIDSLEDALAADTLLRTQLLDFPRDIRNLARAVEIRLRRGSM